MNEETLPPSPNWFLSSVLVHLENGTIAYGSRNGIVIAKCNGTDRTPEVSMAFNAHKERVTVIAPSPTKDVDGTFWHCFASAGEESMVKVWNWETLTPLLAHNAHMEGAKVLAMDWSKVDPHLVVSADEQGTVVSWDLFSNTTHKMNFAKIIPTCLSCCPHKRELVALGTRSGLVCIINLKGDGKLLHRLRGHDTEVVSLAWCPSPFNVLHSRNAQEDMLLASGAKEKMIYIWRAGADGRYETVLHLPSIPLAQDAPGSQKHRTRLGASATGGAPSGGWTCLSWPECNTLLSSSLFGELVTCNVEQVLNLKSSKAASVTKFWKLVHACHGRGLFSIAVSPWTTPANGTLSNGHSVDEKSCSFGRESAVIWTAAQDRQIVAYDWTNAKVVMNVPTLGGFVYCIATSPLDSNRIALGSGDGIIRVWNLSNSASLEIVSLWQKIKGKVMALAWHPTKEGWLAYGTSEGRIGLYDVSCGKQPILFHPYHRRNVYTLCWGPPLCETGDHPKGGHRLYSCGDGEVIVCDPDKPNEEPLNLKGMLQTSDSPTQKNVMRTDIAWKPDFSLVAIGNEDGTVNIFSAPHMKLVQTLYAHKKLIQCVVWHPESTATDTSYSPYQNWLAVASNETVIKVFDLSEFSNDEGDPQLKHVECCVALSGHLNRVVSMCWSPHIGGQLVSVSYDNTAQVWNVPTQQPVANFCSHSSHVYCCAWSPLDPDVLMTGSADFTLRVWKLSKQTLSVPSERKKQKKSDTKSSLKMAASAQGVNGTENSEGKEKMDPRVQDDIGVELAKDEKEATTNAKKKSRKLFFPVSSQGRGQQQWGNCYRLLSLLDNPSSELLPPNLGFFGRREDVLRLLDFEVENHVSSGSFEMAQHMELWRGNIADMLREAARQKQLSDWLVSLAPMASQRLWMEMCKAYSEQLTLYGNYQKAASYLLVCHKVNEAIDLLVDHQLFREALVIARCRLAPDDPTPKKIISSWSKQATMEGNYELAVECLISIGELMEAAMLIRKRNDEGSLKLAALIASKAGSQELASLLASQSLKQSLVNGNQEMALQVAAQHPQLKHLKLMVVVHDTLGELTKQNKHFVCRHWIQHCQHLPQGEKPLLEEISSRFEFEQDDKQEIYLSLLKDFGKSDAPDTFEKVWFVVSAEVALATCDGGRHHLVNALSTCYNFSQQHPHFSQHLVVQLCMWLAPRGPFSHNSVFHSENVHCITRSLRAYLCVGVIDWLPSMEAEIHLECTECANKWHAFLEILRACMNDVLMKESLQYFQDCLKIKKWEHEAATTVAKLRKGETVSGSGDGNPCVDDADGVLVKLERLKQFKQEFENNYTSTPNPFVTYCKIKDLLAQDESGSGKDLSDLLENVWREVTEQN